MVEQAWCDLVTDDSLDGGPAGVNLSSRVMRRPVDRAGAHFGLENRRHRLSFVLQTALDPTKLRSIQSGHLDHRDMHVAFVVDQFAAQGVGEPGNRVLGGTVG